MVSEAVLEGIRAERQQARRIVDACTSALIAFGAEAPGATVTFVVEDAPPAAATPGPRAPRARRATAFTERAPEGGETAQAGKAGLYAQHILSVLGHYSRSPHFSADSTVLRREVAKACKVSDAGDLKFKTDMQNALTKLRLDRKIERTGAVWALVNTLIES